MAGFIDRFGRTVEMILDSGNDIYTIVGAGVTLSYPSGPSSEAKAKETADAMAPSDYVAPRETFDNQFFVQGVTVEANQSTMIDQLNYDMTKYSGARIDFICFKNTQKSSSFGSLTIANKGNEEVSCSKEGTETTGNDFDIHALIIGDTLEFHLINYSDDDSITFRASVTQYAT